VLKKYFGFTLVEMVIVNAITGIIAVIASKILNQAFYGYVTNKNIIDANWQGQSALERMTRELHMIRSPSDITTATASQISFIDINGNAINFNLSGSSLMRNTQILADGISNLTFTYLNSNGSSTATPSAIRYIKISFNITQNNVNYTLTSATHLRDF
jgi:prepilin-type N-terminal cleavage/methylation domain-containing protein